MKPPTKIKVGPFDLTVQHDPKRLKDLEGDAALCWKELLVLIDEQQAPGYLRDSLLHEVLHSLYKQTNLFDNSEEGNEREEKLVQAITPRLLAVLRENPRLMAFLTER